MDNPRCDCGALTRRVALNRYMRGMRAIHVCVIDACERPPIVLWQQYEPLAIGGE